LELITFGDVSQKCNQSVLFNNLIDYDLNQKVVNRGHNTDVIDGEKTAAKINITVRNNNTKESNEKMLSKSRNQT